MIRGLFNRWSRLHIGWKSAVALAAGINTLSFIETFTATRNTMPSYGIAADFDIYERPALQKALIIPHGVGNGTVRGIFNHTRLWLLDDYCNLPSPALHTFLAVGLVAGDAGVIIALPVYGIVGVPGAAIGGAVAGASVAVQELMSDGKYYHVNRCAGTLPYTSSALIKRPSQRP